MTNEKAAIIINLWDDPMCPATPEERTEAKRIAMSVLMRDRWISVKDKLPEQNGLTMITLREGHVGICYFAGGWWGGYERESITHWRPLPEPPKEDKS